MSADIIHHYDFQPKTGFTTPSGQHVETYGKQWLVPQSVLNDSGQNLGERLSRRLVDEVEQAGWTPISPVELTITEARQDDPMPEEWAHLPQQALPLYVRATVKVSPTENPS